MREDSKGTCVRMNKTRSTRKKKKKLRESS